MNDSNFTEQRLEELINWYDTKSLTNQRFYKVIKFFEIISAALIPAAAMFKWPYGVIGLLGLLVIVIEGIPNLYQFHRNWMSYRSTCEDLKKEKHFFHIKAGPYRDVDEPEKLLAERIESLISYYIRKW
jgi:hypothetical protein